MTEKRVTEKDLLDGLDEHTGHADALATPLPGEMGDRPNLDDHPPAQAAKMHTPHSKTKIPWGKNSETAQKL